MRAVLSTMAVGAMLGTAMPACAGAPTVLEPSSKWVINYADDSCRLIRTFGESDQQVRLEFRMFAPERRFWLLVSGKSVDHVSPTGPVHVSLRFDPDPSETDTTALQGKLDETTPAIMFPATFGPRDVEKKRSKTYKQDREAYLRDTTNFDTAREAQISALEIGVGRKLRMTLEVGSMRAPMDAVRACLDNLLNSWGVNAKEQKTLTRPAVPASNPAHWLKSSDYPIAMLREGFSDNVNFRLTVDPTGMPTACDVLTMESRPDFIRATCDNLMKRAHFAPALNAHGSPVASIYVSTVLWRL